MANTVISLKKSATPSATPVSLANGELAINYSDGIIYYKAANGAIASISSGTPSFGTINAGGTLVVADAVNDVFDIRAGQNIIITGDAINDKMTIDVDLTAANSWANTKLSNGTVTLAGALTTTGQITASSQINITPTGGDEGGEIQLQGPGDYTDWSIDSYQNNFRVFTVTGSTTSNVNFFHAGSGSIKMGVNKADPAYTIDVSGDVNITGTYRVNGNPIASGSVDLTPANNWANTLSTTDRAIANDAANSANVYTVTVGYASNNYANASFYTIANGVASFTKSNSAYDLANAAYNYANTIIDTANNNVIFDHANAAFNKANDSYGSANTAANSANSYADAVGTAGNNYTNSVGAASNTYAESVGLASNNYAIQVGAAANNWANTKVDYVVGTAGEIFVTDSNDYNPTINLISTGVVAATYGSATQIATFVVDALGRLTYAANVAVQGMDYPYTNAVGVSANSYADSIGLAGNNYTNTVGTAGNNYTNSVGAASNTYADAVGTAGNNYTNTVGAASNTYAESVGLASNNYTNTVGTAGNNYTNSVGASANNYANITFFPIVGGDILGSVNVAGNFTVTGNLKVSGNTSFISVENYRVDDPLIYLAANNYTSDIVDIGFIANYVNTGGANVHTGLYREHTDKEYYLFQGYDAEPINNHIGALSNNMTLSVLNADLRTSNLSLGGANAILWITDAYNKANAANVLAFNTGIGANAWSNTKVSSVSGTAGEIFSSDGTTPTLNLVTTAVTASTYGGASQIPVLTVDTFGRLTYAANVTVQGMDYVYANQIGAASNTWANTKVSSVSGTAGEIFSSDGTTPTLNLISTAVTASTYGGDTQIPIITVDAFGRITYAANVASGASGGMDYPYANAVGVSANSYADATFATKASPTFTGTIDIASANIKSQILTDASSISWDLSQGTIATVTLGGNRTLSNPSNLKVGTFILHVIQDGTGGRTLGYGSAFKFPAGVAPVLTTTASARDLLSFICDGTNLYGSFLPDVK